jgi:hypothetical protein
MKPMPVYPQLAPLPYYSRCTKAYNIPTTYHQQHTPGVVPAQLTEGTLAMKVQYLTKSGLLQTAAPRDTQFVLSCNEPLPDELLTTLQVSWGTIGQPAATLLDLHHVNKPQGAKSPNSDGCLVKRPAARCMGLSGWGRPARCSMVWG